VVVRKIGARSNENDNYIILSFIYDNIVICNNCNGKEIPILQVSEKEKEK
jgi:glycerophosphoryl diester phosphodiesterase